MLQKTVPNTFDGKDNMIRIMKGPFYKYHSKEGLREDDFVTCAEKDLIDAANSSPL